MRILLMPSSYPPVLGGLQTMVHTLGQYLVQEGHEVQVVTNCYPRYLPSREMLEGVLVHRWLFLTPDIEHLHRRRPDLLLASFYFYPTTLFHLFRLMRVFRPEVVNVHFPLHQIPFVLWLRQRFKFRLVVSLHGDEIERYFVQDSMPNIQPLRRRSRNRIVQILREADAVTACSKYLLNKATQLEPSVVQKGNVIHNGVAPEQFQDKTPYHHSKPYILTFGRLTYEKGFDILLDAFAEVASKHPTVDLILAGQGEEKKALQEQVHRLGLDGQAHFFGRASPKEVVQLLNGCQFVVVPSRWETFGIVLLEAMASGKPVIATRSGGPEEIIEDGINGLLVEKENTKALAEAITRLLNDAKLRDNIIMNLKDFIQRFGISKMVSKYLEVFK